jgi:hypothetical protein
VSGHPRARWVCLVCVLACISVARAEAPLAATQLHELCRTWHSDPDSVAAASCAAYVQGFLDGAADIDERVRRTRQGRPPYCVPRGISLSAMIDQLLVYCETQRLDRDVAARSLLARMLGQFYPCR